MSDQTASSLLPALGIAAFQRTADGSFAPISTVPSWFARLVSDTTFPFLGHILDEANQFWTSRRAGFQEFGPCAEVDEGGREYHYKVLAVSADGGQFLLFQQDPATDRLREVLQKAREQALRAQHEARSSAFASLLRAEATAAADEIRALVSQLDGSRRSSEQSDILQAIAARCNRLRMCAESVAGLTPAE